MHLQVRILLSVLLAFTSCKKDVAELSFEKITTGIAIRLNQIEILNDSCWVVCGGIRNEQGWFLGTRNKGLSWSATKTESPKSIYCMHFTSPDHGYAGGDFLDLWETHDGGISWQFHWLGDQVPFNEEDRPAIRSIYFTSPDSGYFVGGENLGEGVIYHTEDGGLNWDFQFHVNEFRDCHFLSDQIGVVAGHGKILVTENSFDGLNQCALTEDFFTSVRFVDQNTIIAVGNNGGIYKSYDIGKSWKEVMPFNKAFEKRINWNDLAVEGELAVAVGNEGIVGYSMDAGDNWVHVVLSDKINLYSVAFDSGAMLATSDNGIIARFKID